MASLYVLDTVKEVGFLAQRARNCAQSSDVLGMAPAGVVATAIAVRNERRLFRGGSFTHV
jgi:hypothetical protein